MIRINLLPRAEKPSKEALIWRRITIWSLIAAAIVVVIGIGFHLFRKYEMATLKSDIREAEVERDQYRDQAALVRELTEKRKKISERIQVIDQLDQGRFVRVYILDELARSVPEYIWLESFEESGGAIRLTGMAFSNLAISQFMDTLESKDHISSVTLRIIRKQEIDGQPVLSFELGCQIGASEEGAESS